MTTAAATASTTITVAIMTTTAAITTTTTIIITTTKNLFASHVSYLQTVQFDTGPVPVPVPVLGASIVSVRYSAPTCSDKSGKSCRAGSHVTSDGSETDNVPS